ncbi:cell division protein FtsN [Otariodibacter oris]|uniref:Cell division protein FtsN n=1 Tax=Otariodibacter oris TaxID=1032623 RepID=A0A420XFQ7_9PAST|nr:cell division protein FtsN [Otariodibacter oris]QGM80233.1 cell division protein FtsN [Otariodibacter oris]RKR71596.1 cell division protein FtsN [Otariodibacter oris]
MPNRDYAVRKKNKKSGNKRVILLAIIIIVAITGLGLWFLQESAPPKTVPVTQQVKTNANTKHELPSRPEEVYSYIRDLETREVPVDKDSTLAKLTKEQEEQIIKQRELEQRKLEQLAQQAEQARTEAASVEKNTQEQIQAARDSINEKILEEKRQAEEKKQRELAAQKEKEQQQVVTAKPASTPPAQPKPSSAQYGLQCGAFKNKDQAENMQARLAMAGYNARINSSAEWNRVVVGPIGDRAAASAALSNARSVAECLIVRM